MKYKYIFIFFIIFLFLISWKLQIEKNNILKQIKHYKNRTFNFPKKYCVIKSNKHINLNKEKFMNSKKIVCKVNLNCSVCIFNLSKVYKFYLKLKNKNPDLKFGVIVKDYPCSYIAFFLDKALSKFKDYEVWVFKNNNMNNKNPMTSILLIDENNKILICGNFLLHNFLKKQYLSKIK